MELDRAFEHALNGQAILFTGAGFSCGALNLKGEPFKTGGQLADYLGVKATSTPGLSLDDAAEEFAAKFGQDRLIKELELEFTAKQISAAQSQFTRVPWKRVYTTNYDNILENAFQAAGSRLKPVTLSDHIRDVPKDPLLCVHLNGFVGRLTRSSLWSEIKLTDTSYLTASVAASPWATFFRQDLELAQAVFFVGYSLADIDIRRILFESPKLKDKCFFVLGTTPDAATLHRASRFGLALKIDSQKFAAALTEKSFKYAPPENTGPLPHCLRKFNAVPPRGPFQDRFVFNLLLLGECKPEFLWDGLHGGFRYTLERRAVETILARIKEDYKVVVINSDLGNGKSIILEQLKCRAMEAGYAVYSVLEKQPSLHEEIEWALKSAEPKIFVIDGYPDWLTVLQFLASRLDSKTYLVLSCRTSAHDLLADRLVELLGSAEMAEIEIDYLSTNEIQWIDNFFEEYGLWGEKASWLSQQKRDYLVRVCASEWHAILIGLFESPQIRSRFEALFDDIQKEQNFHRVLIAILILTVLGKGPSLLALVDLCGPRVLETAFRRDPAIREIIDFSQGEIQLRSSVAGGFILKQIADPNSTIDVLISLARASDKSADVSPYYYDVCKSLARYSNLQHVLPEKDRGKATLQYYESVKDLQSYRSNPLFWLQYAIACLVIEEFERAGRYFDTAYSLAETRNTYDTYQIDNHYARFLLMRSLRRGDVVNCMADFRSARTILFGQMENERLHYPYRVAAVLGDFFSTFANLLKPEDREEIVRAARNISERIGKLPRSRQQNETVDRCRRVMEEIINHRQVARP